MTYMVWLGSRHRRAICTALYDLPVPPLPTTRIFSGVRVVGCSAIFAIYSVSPSIIAATIGQLM
jgi:hypothetical protein